MSTHYWQKCFWCSFWGLWHQWLCLEKEIMWWRKLNYQLIWIAGHAWSIKIPLEATGKHRKLIWNFQCNSLHATNHSVSPPSNKCPFLICTPPHTTQVVQQVTAHLWFDSSMTQLGLILLPLEEILVHHRVTPSIKFTCTQLYTWAGAGTVRVKCLIWENNVMTWPGLKPRPLNLEASALTCISQILVNVKSRIHTVERWECAKLARS